MALDSFLIREGFKPAPKNAHVKVQPNTCVLTQGGGVVVVTDEQVWVGQPTGKDLHRVVQSAESHGLAIRGLTH